MTLSPRLTLYVDTITCAAMAALLLVLAGPLGGWLDLPVDFLRWVGVILLPWIALLAWFATRQHVTRGMLLAVIAINIVWVAGSIGVLVSNQVDPNGWGVAFVLVQAAAVAMLTGVQVNVLPQATDRQPAMR